MNRYYDRMPCLVYVITKAALFVSAAFVFVYGGLP